MSLEDGLTITMPAAAAERLIAALERLAGTGEDPGGLLTTAQVAERLRKSPRDVQRMVKKGKLRKVPNLGSRTTRFRQADVARLMTEPDDKAGRRRL